MAVTSRLAKTVTYLRKPARLRKIGLGIVLFFVLFTVIGFFVLPPLVKSIATKKLSEALNRPVSIREIRINPYTLGLTIRGFAVKERGGQETFVSFDELYVNLQIMSLPKMGLIFKAIRLEKPYIRAVRNDDFSYNFSDLLVKKEGPPSPPPKFSLNNIEIKNGSVDFVDSPMKTNHQVKDLHIAIPFLSNFPYYVQNYIQPAFRAVVNGTSFGVEGKTKPFADSLETYVDVNLQDLNIPHYLEYLPVKLNAKVQSGVFDLKGRLSFTQSKTQAPTVQFAGDAGLKTFEVRDAEGNPLAGFPSFKCLGFSVELPSRKVHVSKVALEGLQVETKRRKDGSLTFENLFRPKGETAPAPPAPQQAGQKATQEAPFAVDVDEILISGARIGFSDLQPAAPFKTTLDPVEVKIERFSNQPDKRSALALSVKTESGETVVVESDFAVASQEASGRVEIKGIQLRKYDPYYREKVLFDLLDGRLGFSSKYAFKKGEKEPDVKLTEMGLTLEGLRLRKRGENRDFLSVPSFAVRNGQADLTKREIVLGEVATQKGKALLQRLKNGEIDLQKLVPTAPEASGAAASVPKPKEAGPDWVFTLAKVIVDQYAVTFEDSAPSEPVTLALDGFKVRAENLSTAKDRKGKFSVAFVLDKETPLSTAGTLTLAPLKIDGTVEISKLSLKRYTPYYRENLLFDLEEGTLKLATAFQFTPGSKEADVRLNALSLALDNLRLRKRGEAEDFAQVPLLTVRNGAVNLTSREVTVGEVASQKGSLLVRRAKDGKLNLQTLFPPPPAQAPEARPGEPPTPKTGQEPPSKPWLVKVAALALGQYKVRMEDLVPEQAVTTEVDEIDLKAGNLSTAKNSRANTSLSLRLNQGGTFSLTGPVGMDPVVADLKVAAKEIDIRPFQPYFTDRVRIAVTSGFVSAAGGLSITDQGDKGMQVAYKGDTLVSRFASVDKESSEDVLKWDALSLAKMEIAINPDRYQIEEVSLTDYYARVTIFPDGVMNLQKIMVEKPGQPQPVPAGGPKGEKSPPPKEPGTSSEIKIDKVTLQGGRVDFSDQSIKGVFSAKMTQLGGRVSGLSSMETSRADVDLRGKLDDSSPLEIAGKINPLQKDLFVDLTIRFKDIELSPFSPYSGKYVGYTILKGKLHLDLQYLIEKRKLTSKNKVFLDQFTLGDRVESPTATKLPVRLALALLKDRKGEIHLDIPVTGSLDDPKFSIFKVVLQILVNLLAKAATSPFALIGALVGGGGQLDHLDFDYGVDAVRGPVETQLQTLGKVLQDRPGIKIDITGYVDPVKDKEALRDLFFQRKIKAQKLKEMVSQGVTPPPVDEIPIAPADREKYLKAAYREEKFPKPKNVVGLPKDIPGPEMEKLMVTHIEVKEDDLKQLANRRAQNVKDYFLRSKQVEPERIFLVESKALAPEKKEKWKDSRVEFKLK